MNSMPFMPGIFRSVTMQSNRSCSTSAERFDRAGAALDLVARLAEHVGHRLAGRLVIVDHQHAAGVVAGRKSFDFRGWRGAHAAASMDEGELGNAERERGAALGAILAVTQPP